MRSIFRSLLKTYLYVHERLHDRVFHSVAIRAFGGLHPKNTYNFRNEFFLEHVDGADIVLDLACGSGKILGALAPQIKQGIGIELDPKNLVLCRKYFSAPNLEFISGDLLTFSYNELHARVLYNKAIFSHILEHIADMPTLLRKVQAQELLICVPSQENWYRQTMKELGLRYTTDPTHFREYTRNMLVSELHQAGYRASYIGFNSEAEIVCVAVKED